MTDAGDGGPSTVVERPPAATQERVAPNGPSGWIAVAVVADRHLRTAALAMTVLRSPNGALVSPPRGAFETNLAAVFQDHSVTPPESIGFPVYSAHPLTGMPSESALLRPILEPDGTLSID